MVKKAAMSVVRPKCSLLTLTFSALTDGPVSAQHNGKLAWERQVSTTIVYGLLHGRITWACHARGHVFLANKIV